MKEYDKTYEELMLKEFEVDNEKSGLLIGLFTLCYDHMMCSIDEDYNTGEQRVGVVMLAMNLREELANYPEFVKEIESKMDRIYELSRAETIQLEGLDESDLPKERFFSLKELLNFNESKE